VWAAEDDTVPSAVKGVRLHDLRHTAAVLWLTNGVHFIQVAKRLGHSSYVLTLTTYADYITDVDTRYPNLLRRCRIRTWSTYLGNWHAIAGKLVLNSFAYGATCVGACLEEFAESLVELLLTRLVLFALTVQLGQHFVGG